MSQYMLKKMDDLIKKIDNMTDEEREIFMSEGDERVKSIIAHEYHDKDRDFRIVGEELFYEDYKDKEMEMYYRIMYTDGKFAVYCLQDFDEFGYDKETELPLKFKDEDVAKRMANVLNATNGIEFSN